VGALMLSIVTFKWTPYPHYRSRYDAETVNTLFRMVDRHYPLPHRNICVTDDAKGIDPHIDIVPVWNDHGHIVNPSGPHNPSCYRRLKMFAPDAGKTFGERIVVMDLDVVIVRDVTPLFTRTEDFIIWGYSDYPKTQFYNGSLWMLKTGSRPKVWTEFHPRESPIKAYRKGCKGSDQGWLSYIIPNEPRWGTADGVYSSRVHIAPNNWTLPDDARIVVFHGKVDPWSFAAQQIPWVREHYR
jgi:hypothetical protein